MKINDVISSLTASYDDWNNIFFVKNFIRRNHEVSWSDYNPGGLLEPNSGKDLQNLFENKQYSFVLSDFSILQLYYKFKEDNETLLFARLAFYRLLGGTIDESPDLQDQEDELGEEIGPLKSDEEGLIEWIRFDFDPSESRTLVHPECHAHVSGLTSARVPVVGVPSPRQFIEFIISVFYPDKYLKERAESDGTPKVSVDFNSYNRELFSVTKHVAKTLHFRVPGI